MNEYLWKLFVILEFFQGSPRSGPGADRHYKSEKEREEEDDAKRKAKRKKILFGGLGVGIVLGGALGYMSSQSSKKGQISNDNFVKEYLLDTKPPEFK